jgi:hypothetical protein
MFGLEWSGQRCGSNPHAIPVPAHIFSHLHVDIVGPLPTSSVGFVHLLTIIDRSARCVEAVPMKSMEASRCVDAFISTWVARFGLPCAVTTDRALSSHHHCGLARAQGWGSSTSPPKHSEHTIPRVMVWWRGCTGRSRMPYVHMLRDRCGLLIYRGCSWAYLQPPKKTPRPFLHSSW